MRRGSGGTRGRLLAVWVAAVAGARLLGAENIIINELMYRPASNDMREEYLELFNRSTNSYNLAGWRFTSGLDFTFPAVVLRPGAYLVVAADLAVFTNKYPDVTNVVGGWQGHLGHHGETLRLRNPYGQVESTAGYATEGDWAVRQRGPDDHGHRGWVWAAEHDGGGKSLELINPLLGNGHGQNWAASLAAGGTPGRPNSVARTNVAPMILEVAHFPVVPRSTNTVAVTARLLDEWHFGVTARLFYRVDGEPAFSSTPMVDDGQHGDGAPADRVFGALLPARPNNTVVEFYVSATDAQGNTRTWPAPVQPEGTQAANCLYQVGDSSYGGTQPLYRLITTEAERLELAEIGEMLWYWNSDAQMNATFISAEAGDVKLRYLVGFRNRGGTSRALPTKSRRINFREDDLWRGRRSVDLNANSPHAQVIGSVLCQLAGLPLARARTVQMRENNLQLAGTNGPPFGVYAEVEVMDSTFTDAQFPLDSAGNLYHAYGNGDLSYQGPSADPYRQPGSYTKQSNASQDDWSDLIELTRVLNTVPDEAYTTQVQRVANVEEWLRYFAVNILIGNAETSLGTGGPGDYALYCGVADPRFQLLMYDLETLLGDSSSPTTDLFRAAKNPTVSRFLKWPDFAPLYFAELKRLTETTFAPANLNPVLDRFLGSYVPAGTIQAMKDFVVARNAYVLSQIPRGIAAYFDPPVVYRPEVYANVTTQAVASLHGLANAIETRQVRVAGQAAIWTAWRGSWQAVNVPLHPGVNRLVVQAFNAQGREIENQSIYVWYETGASNQVAGVLPGDTLWDAAGGPYVVSGDLIVPAGVTLRIDAGASVFFQPDARMVVFGRLLAEGTPERHIRFSWRPGETRFWRGVAFSGATNENRLTYVDMSYLHRTALAFTNSVALIDHVSWAGTWQNIIYTENSSLQIRNSVFPNLSYDEHIQGMGLPPDGWMIIEGNTFGTTTSYQDIIDFTGGHRPGAIIQVLNNVFTGGSDDALDLDGTDAHVEGNVFMHFHKNNDSTSESSAIAAGSYSGQVSAITAVRNVFFDNDYHMVMKEGASLTAQHNTFVGSRRASFCIFEPGRPGEGLPKALWLDGNIFWNEPALIGAEGAGAVASGQVDLWVAHSLLPWPDSWNGEGNLSLDPLFLNPTGDFRLRPGSPATAAGPNGLDMGAYVPAGASLSGEPPADTWRQTATLTVGGPGITHFKYRVNDGPLSSELPLEAPIELSGLTNGAYTVFVVGKNSAGVWQADTNATASRSWRVNTRLKRLRINEVLAQNVTAVPVEGGFPDLVELHNEGSQAADLSGLSLSDDPTQPAKFTFLPGASLAPDAYLVLIADNHTNAPGLHLGFSLEANGEGVFLYDSFLNGGALLDSVRFGPQLPDLSIGRLADGLWSLTQPTFGGPNRPQLVGDPRRLRINEWLANGGTIQRDDFVELYNPDPQPVALGGLSLSDQPVGEPRRHVISPLSFIEAGGFAVFVADGQGDKKPNHLNFRLSAEQGIIGLFDADETLIDLVAYGAQLPDISEGRSPSGSATVVSFVLPTPGNEAASADDPRHVVINEVLACNSSSPSAGADLPDWVELYNRSTNAINLAGMSLSDQFGSPGRWQFPPGAAIAGKGYLVIACDGQKPASGTNTGFGLSAEGDEVYLFDASGRSVDGVAFGVQTANLSIGRIPDGTGAWRLNQVTSGRSNAETAIGVPSGLKINEWMASPAAGDDWFEVYNPGRLPFDLGGLWLTDDLTQPMQHQIPPLSFIGVGAYGYQVFVADGNSGAGANHVGFRLSAEGDELGLATTNGFFLDRVLFGAQLQGVAQGRYPDGTESIASFPTSASPGRANTYNSPPMLLPIADQAVAPGGTVWLTFAALDADRPAQQLTFSLGSTLPPGASLDPLTGAFSWTTPENQPAGAVLFRVTVTDNGVPNLSASRSFIITVTASAGPRLNLAVNGGIARLSWTAKPSRIYLLEFKNDLAEPAWTPLSEVSVLGTNALFLTTLGGSPVCFYRLTLLP